MRQSLYSEFRSKWSNGCGNAICEMASHRVFARGTLPCDVLFVGEAPGPTEDPIGLPFVGQAGHLLDTIIGRALHPTPKLTYALTNIVCCIPREKDGTKAMEPMDDEVKHCQPRLKEFIEVIAKPRLIVCVGVLARDWMGCSDSQGGGRYKFALRLDNPPPMVDIIHPAAILRANIAQRGITAQRCVVTIVNAIYDHITHDKK